MKRTGGRNPPRAVADTLASNLRRLRAARGWSLDQVAARAGISKGMIVQLTRGGTNPSLATLCRLANAFGVTVPRLVEAAPAPPVRVVRAGERATLWRGRPGSVAQLLAGLDEPELAELWDWRLSPGDAYRGEAHPAGSHELLHVLKGRLSLRIDESGFIAAAGETVVFRADRRHTYATDGQTSVRFMMVVVEPKPPEAPSAGEADDARPRRYNRRSRPERSRRRRS